MGELRVRLPEVADEQSAREALDSALRLLGLDLLERCMPVLPEGWETRRIRASANPDQVISPHDPVTWLQVLRFRDHPVHRALPVIHKALRSDIKRVIDARNDLFHFRQPYEPDVAAGVLMVMARLSRLLGLPCQEEIDAQRRRLIELMLGEAPTATVADIDRRVQEVARLRTEVEQLTKEREEALEAADRAIEDLKLARGQEAGLRSGEAATKQSLESAQHQIRDLNAELERLQQEAEINAAHARILVDRANALDDIPTESPQLPPADASYLAHAYAAIVCIQQLLEKGTFKGAETIAPGTLTELQAALDERLVSLTRLGVRQDFLPDDLEALDLEWALDEMERAEIGAEVAEREAELGSLGADERDALSRLRKAITSLAYLVYGVLEPFSMYFDGDVSIEPGDPWPYDRGDSTWTLSPVSRELRRTRGRCETTPLRTRLASTGLIVRSSHSWPSARKEDACTSTTMAMPAPRVTVC